MRATGRVLSVVPDGSSTNLLRLPVVHAVSGLLLTDRDVTRQ